MVEKTTGMKVAFLLEGTQELAILPTRGLPMTLACLPALCFLSLFLCRKEESLPAPKDAALLNTMSTPHTSELSLSLKMTL